MPTSDSPRAPAEAGAQNGRAVRLWLWAPACAGALAVAGCGQAAHRQEEAKADAAREAALPRFACATGSAALRSDCTAERERTDKGWVITLRHPDGHFRRVLVADDRVTAADGAETAHVTPGTTGVEVAIGRDRYLLPVQR